VEAWRKMRRIGEDDIVDAATIRVYRGCPFKNLEMLESGDFI